MKWKHLKDHTERSKYLHPGVEIFSFSPEFKGTCISKKNSLRGEFYLALRVTCFLVQVFYENI